MYSQSPQEATSDQAGTINGYPAQVHPYLAYPFSPAEGSDTGETHHELQLNTNKADSYAPTHTLSAERSTWTHTSSSSSHSVCSSAWASPQSSQYTLNPAHDAAQSYMSASASPTARPITSVAGFDQASTTERSPSQRHLGLGSLPVVDHGPTIRPLRSDKRLSSHFPLASSRPGSGTYSGAESATSSLPSSLASARRRIFATGTDTSTSASSDSSPREELLSPAVDDVSFIYPSPKIGSPTDELPNLTSPSGSDLQAPTVVEPKAATTEDPVGKLADNLELLSFLKTHREESPEVVLPFPLASSAQSISISGASNASPPNDDPESQSPPAEWKEANTSKTQRVRDELWECAKCHKELGRLLLRDPMSQPPIPFLHTFLCSDCCPPEEEHATENPVAASASSDLAVSYESGFSGLLDKESNIPIPTRKTPRVQASGKRRRLTGSLSTCDVCMHFIATSSAQDEDSLRPPSAPLVERVCKHCHAKYRRCTDCGGRPDKRLGVGRWRLKELFPDGTRRCIIPHRPLRSLTETTCDVWRVSELPSDEVPAYLTEIQKVMSLAMFATMAIPDTMECESPMCIDFRSAAVLASEAFRLLTPLITTGVEESLRIRRYITLRWHNPLLPRGERLAVPPNPQSQDPDVIALQKPPNLVREEYTLFAFNYIELELETGSIAVALSAPRGMGHSYHAQTHSIQCAIRRAQHDLAKTNRERVADGLDAYPEINELWLINGHNKASRVLHRDERQRGMIPLDEYLVKHASVTDPKHFPPHRSILLPWEFLKRYRFYARRFSGKDDLTKILGRRKTAGGNKARRGRLPVGADNGSNVTIPKGKDDESDDEDA
ncbi:BZ3500_MvSof-1268-A1-R1_Chr2-2g04757 [Microbotryum saponariae]|uniref:BZ3500_MvSof-1268-A1-R1_Chr2-2g04757 protein n=1 Tax=Microbotryum saponariae TaxID=289078 RepID=A0A2X0L5H6_9BASI|nr:BZ3500_MvSof-1268-A1-R1_Chr2-2g04757 [Microbotryum saponariae]SDA00090.1 BZ3501_MvSof-1269-A2-R1_Chr2-2g04431 [Microbotryum saponariae]